MVADRIKVGLEKRVKYIVTNDGSGPDMIFNPSQSLTWRQNGSYKTEHRSHAHVSILYTDAAEQDTTPFYVGVGAPTPPPTAIVPQEDTVFINYLGQLHGFYVSADKNLWQRFEGADGAVLSVNISAVARFTPHNIDGSRPIQVAVAPNLDLVVGAYGLEGVYNEARWSITRGVWTPRTFR